MIFSFNPEERNKVVFRKERFLTFCKNDGCQCFINGVERAGEKARLLTGYDRHATGRTKLFDFPQVQFRAAVPCILTAKDRCKQFAVERTRLKLSELTVVVTLIEVVKVKASGNQAITFFSFRRIVFEERRKSFFRGQDCMVVEKECIHPFIFAGSIYSVNPERCDLSDRRRAALR